MNTDRQSPSAAPAVTVIMNIRDGEEYLRESIDSVLAQSFEDFELICFDDMSKDASVAIVQSYHDPRIRLIHSELDLTLGKARCAAIGHAAPRALRRTPQGVRPGTQGARTVGEPRTLHAAQPDQGLPGGGEAAGRHG